LTRRSGILQGGKTHVCHPTKSASADSACSAGILPATHIFTTETPWIQNIRLLAGKNKQMEVRSA